MTFAQEFGPALMGLDAPPPLDLGGDGEHAHFDTVHRGTSPEALAALAAEDLQEAEARFCIDSEDKANWLLRKIGNIDAERRRVKAQADDILRGLDAEEARLRARFESDLAAWSLAEMERRGSGKTLKLMQANVSFRTVPATVRVRSETDAIDHARARGWEIVRTVESLDREAYKREAMAALAEGELIPGVEAVPERQSFNFKFRADKEEHGDA